MFKEGDVVRLESGGPDMTVESTSDVPGRVSCLWFVGRELHKGDFPADELRAVNMPPHSGPTGPPPRSPA